MPDILNALPAPIGGGPKRLSCFTTHSSANQYFELADSANSTVLDASNDKSYQLLSERYSTSNAWLAAKIEDIESILGQESDLASVLLKRVRAELDLV